MYERVSLRTKVVMDDHQCIIGNLFFKSQVSCGGILCDVFRNLHLVQFSTS